MDNQAEVREFLTTRRAKIEPARAGLPAGPGRRVAGLRRSEVAMLAGVSVEYYARLERGVIAGASDSVLHAIATALRFDAAERAHLFDLARAANESPTTPRRRRSARFVVPIALQQTLDAITAGPAFIRNGRMDLLATNALARAFYSPAFDAGRTPTNLARFQFLDRSAEDFYVDWSAAADVAVAILRTEAGRDPHDHDLQELVGELSTRSEEFRRRWGNHDVRHHATGMKAFRHPVVGEMTLSFQAAELVGETALTLTVYTAEPSTASDANLRLLASWAASAPAEAHTTEPAELDRASATREGRNP